MAQPNSAETAWRYIKSFFYYDLNLGNLRDQFCSTNLGTFGNDRLVNHPTTGDFLVPSLGVFLPVLFFGLFLVFSHFEWGVESRVKEKFYFVLHGFIEVSISHRIDCGDSAPLFFYFIVDVAIRLCYRYFVEKIIDSP